MRPSVRLGMVAAAALAIGCSLDRTGVGPLEGGPRDAGPSDAPVDSCPPEGCPSIVMDDTFEDFAAGTRGDSVANLYVHARGTVQTVMRSDVDRDGYPDLVLGSSTDGTTNDVPSRIYFGAPGGPDPMAMPLEVPTIGAFGSALADLDADGFADLVFANHENAGVFEVSSYVYYGTESGFGRRTELPTTGASGVTIADVDEDGWLDVIFASHRITSGSTHVPSQVYLGAAAGFQVERRIDLPTIGAIDVCAADFDRDGHVDLLFTNYYDDVGMTYAVPAHLYWGSSGGPTADPGSRLELPVQGGYGCAVADLDNDDQLDVVIAQHNWDGAMPLGSIVFYGHEGRPDATRTEPLATSHGALPSIADVDDNEYLDVIIGNAISVAGMRATDSNVFFRTAGGFSAVLGYPTQGAYGTAALDWTGDGRIDLFFSSFRNDGMEYRLGARLYGSQATEPPKRGSFDAFPTLGGWGGMANDLGNTYDRSFVERFESRVFDLGAPPREVFLDWIVMLPTGTMLRMKVRTAETRELLEDALWYGARGSDSFFEMGPVRIPGAQRFVQYRAYFEAPNAVSSPVLDRVAWTWR